MSTSNGTIKRIVSDKGFGFIAADDGQEYFFHQSACNGTPFDGLTEGMAVTFEIAGDHIALRPAPAARQPAASGFGLIQSQREAVPADFDVASLVIDAP